MADMLPLRWCFDAIPNLIYGMLIQTRMIFSKPEHILRPNLVNITNYCICQKSNVLPYYVLRFSIYKEEEKEILTLLSSTLQKYD